jgi:ankyrin repeat protein
MAFIENKADVGAQGVDDWMTLHWASRHGQVELVQVLLEYRCGRKGRIRMDSMASGIGRGTYKGRSGAFPTLTYCGFTEQEHPVARSAWRRTYNNLPWRFSNTTHMRVPRTRIKQVLYIGRRKADVWISLECFSSMVQMEIPRIRTS